MKDYSYLLSTTNYQPSHMVIQIKRPFVFLSLLVLLFSCKVALVPEYNATLDEQIAKAAQENDRLYIDMLDVPASERLYKNFMDRYNSIESEINAIQLKNEARKNNADFMVII